MPFFQLCANFRYPFVGCLKFFQTNNSNVLKRCYSMFTYITINTIPYCIPQILPTPPIIKRIIFNHFSLAGLTKQKCDQYKCSIGHISAVGLNGANRNPKTPPTCLCFGLDSSVQPKIFYLIQNSGGNPIFRFFKNTQQNYCIKNNYQMFTTTK